MKEAIVSSHSKINSHNNDLIQGFRVDMLDRIDR